MTDKLSEQQKKRLAEAGQAAVNMSHGIKNIAQSIRSGQEVMDKALQIGNLDVANRTWSILRENLNRIEKLSLNMLAFSRDDPLQTQACDFNELAESVVNTLRPQAKRKNTTVVLTTDQKLEPISIDPEKMRDAVINLVINAIEAVKPETGKVEITTEQVKEQIVLSVCDNGPGIENPNMIFEPFYSTKKKIGTGLGLAIAQDIIQKHNGTIAVQSTSGKGTVFTVLLPISLEK